MPRILLFNNTKIFVHRISIKMFFGVATTPFEDFEIPVSDAEKTLIDLVYFGYVVDDYVYPNLVSNADSKKLSGYLGMCSEDLRKSVKRVVSKYA